MIKINLISHILIFPVLLFFIFFISRKSIQLLYERLRYVIKHDNPVYIVISLLYFPGTVLHELAHAVMAVSIGLKVRTISLIPSWKTGQLKLGYITYDKKDVFRGTLVGVAPVFVGIIFLFSMSYFGAFFQGSIGMNVVHAYTIFVISSTMFSSRQDMIDGIYVLPAFFIVISLIMYFIRGSIVSFLGSGFASQLLEPIFIKINFYLFITILIHGMIIGILSTISYLYVSFFRTAKHRR